MHKLFFPLWASSALALLLFSCGQSENPTTSTASPTSIDNPYANGAKHPWSDRLESTGAAPYQAGRLYPWKGLTLNAPSGITAQDLAVGENFLSDITWTSASNGWGPIETDRSNGEYAAGDGRTLTLGGQSFTKGLGVHADSEVRYALNNQCTTFSAQLGIDDEVGDRGSVTFQVWGNGIKLFDSGVLRGSDSAKSISVPVNGVSELKLIVTNGGNNGDYDHADWAAARVSCAAPLPNGTAAVSDLAYTTASSGWGPIEKDRSNGEQALGDGRTLTIGGQTFLKGLGVHSPSVLTYNLGGVCTAFSAKVGIDDEVGDHGSVTFEVWGDGVKLSDSGVLKGSDGAKAISTPVTGVRELKLVVTNAGDNGDYDHADWAAANVTCGTQGAGDTTNPSVALVGYDNMTHLLTGTGSDDRTLASVKVYDGAVLAGEAHITGTTWSLTFNPTDSTTSIRAVATDTAGNTATAMWNLENNAAATITNLNHPAMLLRLPVAPGAETRYTLDGSAVTSDAPIYTAPLILLSRSNEKAVLSYIPTTPLDPAHNGWWMWKTPQQAPELLTVVRTQQFKSSVASSSELSRTYRIAGTSKQLPIVSLMTAPKNFFDDATGIYVPGNVYKANPDWSTTFGTGNYYQSGSTWERPVSVSFYGSDGLLSSSQLAGVRVHGSASSALAEKSLRLYASKDYDVAQPLFNTSLLPSSGLTSFKRLIIHSSGQDSSNTKIKDCAIQNLLSNRTLDAMACTPIAVYLNGEYWGLSMLRERYDEYYLSAHHALDKNNIVVMNGDGTLDVGQNADVTPYNTMVQYFRTTDLSSDANYATALTQLDVDNFIDYIAAEVYSGNTDWPANNIKLWRTRAADPASTAFGDTRWRWLFYDTDYAFLSGTEPTLAKVLDKDYSSEYVSTKVIFSSLSKNAGFRKRFVDRMNVLLDTSFSQSSFSGQVASFYNAVLPEMPAHINRWSYPASMSDWQYSVNSLYTFAAQRPNYLRGVLNQYLTGN